jgi:hypothetical protein
MIKHFNNEELKAGFDKILVSPTDNGVLAMIVSRPEKDERVVQELGELSLEEGLVGDNWRTRGSKHSKDGSALIEAQLTIMNWRMIDLLTQDKSRWPLAGDQLYVDFDLSADNISPGQRLEIGTAVIEVSALPHNGCKKFSQRFGVAATQFINTPEGKRRHLRGINARIIQPGIIKVGDEVRKL